MKLQPLFSTVLVQVEKKQEQTDGGIFIPDNVSSDRPQVGTVEAVGPGKEKPVCVSVGQKIVYKKYSPDVVKIAEQEFTLLDESDILAVVTE